MTWELCASAPLRLVLLVKRLLAYKWTLRYLIVDISFKDWLVIKDATCQGMQQQARWSNQIAQQDGMRRKHIALDAIQPQVAPDKQVPGQHVAPFFRDKVGIATNHVTKRCLRIAGWIKDIIEFRQWRRDARALGGNRGGENGKMNERNENGYFCIVEARRNRRERTQAGR